MKKGLVWALIVLLLALTVSGCGGGSPSDALQGFLTAVDDNNYDQAKSYLTGAALARFNTEYFDGGVDYFHEKGGINEIEILDEYVYEDVAEVDFMVTYHSGFTEVASAMVIKEDGKWKLPEFGLSTPTPS